jgi:hypothetical protein
MYLQALNNGFVVLEPGVEFMSVDNLPKVVSVSCWTNMFSYEICDSVIDTRINVPAVVHAKTTTAHVNPLMHKITILYYIKAHWGKNYWSAHCSRGHWGKNYWSAHCGRAHIEAKTIDLPIVVEAIEAKTSYKRCIDNIGASISLVYSKNWQNILHVLVKPWCHFIQFYTRIPAYSYVHLTVSLHFRGYTIFFDNAHNFFRII